MGRVYELSAELQGRLQTVAEREARPCEEIMTKSINLYASLQTKFLRQRITIVDEQGRKFSYLVGGVNATLRREG